jgi:hypothetical protein
MKFLSKTEQFNAIMSRVNEAHNDKRKQKIIKFTPITPRNNMNALQTSLSKCTVAGNTVRLPEEMLANYQDVRKALMNAGAKYQRNTFVFPNDATPYINRLMDGESVNIKKEFQAFFTPDDIGDWMAENLFVEPGDRILEPNGGDGALIKALRRAGHNNPVYTYELNPISSAIVAKMENVTLLGDDFLKADKKWEGYFNRIIANPPFSKNQDVTHVLKMWDMLAPGGRLVSVMSNHSSFANGKKETQFREWLEAHDAGIYGLDSGRFKSSGTMVSSQIIIVDKDRV